MAQTYIYLTDSAGTVWQVAVNTLGQLVQTASALSGASIAASPVGSGSRQEIIELASRNTERKGESQLDLPRLLDHGIKKFCSEKRFWWRKKNLTFTTTANVSTYDLSSVTTNPLHGGLEVEEVTKLVYVKSATDITELTPIFDDLEVINMIENTTASTPGVYTFDPNYYQQLRINLPADAYTLRMTFWAMPNPNSESTDDLVPLVPRYLHHCLVDRLEMDILRRLYGPADPKYLSAKEEYLADVERAMAKNSFDASYVQNFSSRESAIRSTR